MTTQDLRFMSFADAAVLHDDQVEQRLAELDRTANGIVEANAGFEDDLAHQTLRDRHRENATEHACLCLSAAAQARGTTGAHARRLLSVATMRATMALANHFVALALGTSDNATLQAHAIEFAQLDRAIDEARAASRNFMDYSGDLLAAYLAKAEFFQAAVS